MSADLHQYTYDMPYVSNCCGVEVYCDTDICSDCKEHCIVVSYEEDNDNDTDLKFKYQQESNNEFKSKTNRKWIYHN